MPIVKRQKPPPKTTPRQTRTSKSEGAVSRILPVSRASVRKDTINIYGVSGTGKTTLACTYPKPLLLVGAEDGTRSVRTVPGVDFVQMESCEDLEDLVGYVKDGGEPSDSVLTWARKTKAPKTYQSFVLDTATSFQSMNLMGILGLTELPAQSSWGLASRDQYGQSALQTKEYLRKILKLAESGVCHTIILAQEREFKSDTDDSELDIVPRIMSALTPSTVDWLNPACDYIVQTFIREGVVEKTLTLGKGKDQKSKVTKVKTGKVEFCLRTLPHPVYMIKFRGPKEQVMPKELVDPTYAKIQKLIEGD